MCFNVPALELDELLSMKNTLPRYKVRQAELPWLHVTPCFVISALSRSIMCTCLVAPFTKLDTTLCSVSRCLVRSPSRGGTHGLADLLKLASI